MIPVIMAGGSGMCLSPLSHTAFPEQFLAADHVIRYRNFLQQAAMQLLSAVWAAKFATLGSVPTGPATDYGYIKVGSAENDAPFAIDQFVEKPDQDTAQQYLTEKNDQDASKWQCSSRIAISQGVDNLVIDDTPYALLVARKYKVQDLKNIVAEIKAASDNEHHQYSEAYRPWDKCDSVDNGERYQVKRITVKLGAEFSVQMHHHRAEHWIVVLGTAKVSDGDKTFLETENKSAYIPIGQMYCLENPGVIELEMIEVKSGSYLGDDDIVREKDHYGRV